MREANRSPTCFQVKESDVDFPGTCISGEIVLPKLILCYRRFLEILFLRKSPPRSPNLHPYNFWLPRVAEQCDVNIQSINQSVRISQGHGPIKSLSDLKESIERHVRNIPQFMLLSKVERVILRSLMVADNGRRHIEHDL
ncbi:hypothetical protein TNCV_870641 [Trichonephila clavipes]|nr:hypothetical protein TNCV_870641 [Trichonephila clavipes]